jgi:CubicO group peptidase (beta-lactamase class C family)
VCRPESPACPPQSSRTVSSEQRLVDLGEPIRRYGTGFPEPGATIRQVMTHTSGSTGDPFHYDPDRYASLTPVVEACIPQPYRKTVAVNLLERLAMRDSVPGRDLINPNVLPQPLFAVEVLERYRKVLDRLAVPYKVDKRGRLTRTELPPDAINAATGLVSTVRDLARFDAALDRPLLLREETLAAAWTPQSNAAPVGLGWFVQYYRGEPVVWHFGLIQNGYSSLIVKLPSRDLTLILLANSDGLSAPFQLEAGDVTKSLFATIFLRLYT